MGNRLKEIRELRKVKAAKAAAGLGISRSEYYKLERSERRLTDVWIGKLSRFYDVAAGDLVGDGNISVTMEVTCCRFVNARDDIVAFPQQYVEAPSFVRNPEDCFGFHVADDSANRLYPRGTTGIARRLQALGRQLMRGDRVVARHFKTNRRDGTRLEDVVGIVDIVVNGDLIVLMPTDDRQLAGAITLRAAQAKVASWAVPANGQTIDYEPQDDDRGEILGVVVAATIPQ